MTAAIRTHTTPPNTAGLSALVSYSSARMARPSRRPPRLPAAAPGNAKRIVGPMIACRIWPVFAPSARRRPISRVRLATKEDVTANTPVAATDSALVEAQGERLVGYQFDGSAG